MSLNDLNIATSIVGEFYKIAKIVHKALKADNEKAASDLVKILKNVRYSSGEMVKWPLEFKRLDLGSIAEFNTFKDRYDIFRIQDNYGDVFPKCREIMKIYNKKLSKPIDRLFKGKQLENIQKIFHGLGNSDFAMESMAVKIFKESLDPALKEIEKDYNNAQAIREKYVDPINQSVEELKNHAENLGNLQKEFLEKI